MFDYSKRGDAIGTIHISRRENPPAAPSSLDERYWWAAQFDFIPEQEQTYIGIGSTLHAAVRSLLDELDKLSSDAIATQAKNHG